MIPSNKEVLVGFADEKIKQAFAALKHGKGAEPDLYDFLDRAFDDLWKYDLPDGWRLIYTLRANQVTILTVVLEWFVHKEYERRFGY